MPLIECPECAKEISDRASKCPHCGYPLQDSETNSKLQKEADTIWERFKKRVAQGGCIFWISITVILILLPPVGIPLLILVFLASFASEG